MASLIDKVIVPVEVVGAIQVDGNGALSSSALPTAAAGDATVAAGQALRSDIFGSGGNKSIIMALNTVGTNAGGSITITTGASSGLDGGGTVALGGALSLSIAATGVTNDMLAGSIANAKLANSSVSLGGVSVSLGGTDATPAFDLQDATGYPTSALVGTITNAQLAGSIANDKLANSSVSLGGVSVSLGGSDATPAFDLQDATGYPTSALVGTITNAQLAGSITNDKLAGSIANDKLANSSVSLGGVSVSLGGSDATPAFDLQDATGYPTSALVGTITNAQLAGSIANAKLANSSLTVTAGSGLSGGGAIALGAAGTVSLDLTSANTWTGVQKFDEPIQLDDQDNAGTYYKLQVKDGLLQVEQVT